MLAIVVGVKVDAVEVEDDLLVAVVDDHAVPVRAHSWLRMDCDRRFATEQWVVASDVVTIGDLA